MNTIWIDIEGYEGMYQVNNLGEVKSLNRIVGGPHGSRLMNGRLLKTHFNKNQLIVNLCKDNIKSKKRVHRLVAAAFIPNPLSLLEVNHIDGNSKNNCAINLEWIDRKGNIEHAVINKLYPRGESHYKAVLSNCDVLEIRSIYSAGIMNQATLAKKYNVSCGLIKDVVRHNSWKHVGGEKTLNVRGGEQDVSSKLKDKEVIEINELYEKRTFLQREIAVLYGISQAQVNRIVNGKRVVK